RVGMARRKFESCNLTKVAAPFTLSASITGGGKREGTCCRIFEYWEGRICFSWRQELYRNFAIAAWCVRITSLWVISLNRWCYGLVGELWRRTLQNHTTSPILEAVAFKLKQW